MQHGEACGAEHGAEGRRPGRRKGTRLFPLTLVTNKHLLPVYDRPMIYYPLAALSEMGCDEVMVVVGGRSVGDILELLHDGSDIGLDLTYRYQRGALGIAHAIGLAQDFAGGDPIAIVLGDNIVHGSLRGSPMRSWARRRGRRRAQAVPDPERFGVAELDARAAHHRIRGEARASRRAT